MSPRSPRSQNGFTLVELLVVLVLLTVVGTVIAGSLIQGQRAEARAQARIEAFEDMRISLERMSRDVRAADPLLVAEEHELQMELLRDDRCLSVRYWVDLDGVLHAAEARSPDTDCDNVGPSSERVILTGLADRAVFTYETAEYQKAGGDFVEDADGNRLRVETTSPGQVRFVRVTFIRTLFEQQPVRVSTVVGLRNAT